MSAKCDNCGLVVADDDVKEAKHLWERVDAGGTMPSGECPYCGALAYPTEEPVSKFKLRLTVDLTYDPHGEPGEALKGLLRQVANEAAGNGLFTGETAAEVETWTAKVEELPS